MLPDDPYPHFDTLSLTQLGTMFGTTAQAVGHWLKDIGLRLPNGQPAPKAVEGGLARMFTPEGGTAPFWVWRKLSVVRLLETAGHRRPVPGDASSGDHSARVIAAAATAGKASERKLTGPFRVEHAGEADLFEIRDSVGPTGVRVRGQVLARRLNGMLNVFWQSSAWFSDGPA